MKKIIIFVAVVVVLLVGYLLVSNTAGFNKEGNQANVISNLFSKDKAVTPQADSGKLIPTGSGKRAPTPTVERFKSNDMSKMQEIYIDGLKKKNPRTEVPR